MRITRFAVLSVIIASASSAHAGPVGEFGIGYLMPRGETKYPEMGYVDIVDAGLHLSLDGGWLFPVHRDDNMRVSIGPVAAAELTRYGVDEDDAMDSIDRWRWLAGARVAIDYPRVQWSLQGLAGLDRPTYDWNGLLEGFCGDRATTNGFGWEVDASGKLAVGKAVFGVTAGVLYADHTDDQPACSGDIVVDVVDYESWDLSLQFTGGVSF